MKKVLSARVEGLVQSPIRPMTRAKYEGAEPVRFCFALEDPLLDEACRSTAALGA